MASIVTTKFAANSIQIIKNVVLNHAFFTYQPAEIFMY